MQYESEGGTYLRYGEEGEHVIIVDLSMMDVRIIQPIYELPYNGIWIVGSACDVGWPSGNDLESVLREKEHCIMMILGILNAGLIQETFISLMEMTTHLSYA